MDRAAGGVLWVSTFHSACVRILRREATRVGLRSNFSIYDAADSQRLMSLVCRELDLDPKRYPPRAFSAQVSNLKNELVDEETHAGRSADGAHNARMLAEAYIAGGDLRGRTRSTRRPDHDDGEHPPGVPRRRRLQRRFRTFSSTVPGPNARARAGPGAGRRLGHR